MLGYTNIKDPGSPDITLDEIAEYFHREALENTILMKIPDKELVDLAEIILDEDLVREVVRWSVHWLLNQICDGD